MPDDLDPVPHPTDMCDPDGVSRLEINGLSFPVLRVPRDDELVRPLYFHSNQPLIWKVLPHDRVPAFPAGFGFLIHLPAEELPSIKFHWIAHPSISSMKYPSPVLSGSAGIFIFRLRSVMKIFWASMVYGCGTLIVSPSSS